MKTFRETYIVRVLINDKGDPEYVEDCKSSGGLGLTSKASALHEERLLKYGEKQRAQAQAATIVEKAHIDGHAKVQAAQIQLDQAHKNANAKIEAKRQEHEASKRGNQVKLSQARSTKQKKVSDAQTTAENRKTQARQHG